MKKEIFKNAAIVSNSDGLLSIFCDYEKRGSEYFFLDNDTHEVKARFASQGCLDIEQLLRENETLFELRETFFDKETKHLIVKVKLDLSYEVLHKIEDIELGMEDGAFAIRKKGLWGFIDYNGIEFIKPQYEDYASFSCGLAGVYKNGRWGFINKKNELIIPYEYEFPERIRCQWKEYNNERYVSVMKNGKWGIIDSSNNTVIPFRYDYLGNAEELIYAEMNNKQGFIDINNNIAAPFIYDIIPDENMSENYCENSSYELICKNGLTGLFDTNKKIEIIPCIYKELKADDYGIIAKKQNDKYVLLDFENNELSGEFERIRNQFENMFSVFNGEASAFMNKNGEILTPFIYARHPHLFHDGLCIAAYKDYNKGYDVINKKGEILYHAEKFKKPFNAGNGYILARDKNGEYKFKKLI